MNWFIVELYKKIKVELILFSKLFLFSIVSFDETAFYAYFF